MEPNFQGKRALVTGAGKGIGRGIAIKMASLGAHVIALSRTQADLDSLQIEKNGENEEKERLLKRFRPLNVNTYKYELRDVMLACSDVIDFYNINTLDLILLYGQIVETKMSSIETCLVDIENWENTRETVEKLGHIDLLVNNAAIVNHSSFFDITKEQLDSVFHINFRAAFNIAQIAARTMVAKGNGGAIVNISSIAGLRAFPNHTTYCPSKAAMDMLTKTLALELGPHKIRVNSVSPTVVMTEMGKKGYSEPTKKANVLKNIPLGRFAEIEDVVNTTVFLLSEQASMINGTIMPVDGEVEDIVNTTIFLLSEQASMISGTIVPVDGVVIKQDSSSIYPVRITLTR